MGRLAGQFGVVLFDSIDVSDELRSFAPAYGSKNTFADMRDGSVKQIVFEADQNTTPESVWSLGVDTPGALVPVLWKPEGNDVATDAQPHWSGTAKTSAPTGDGPVGGDAQEDEAEGWTSEFTWKVDNWTRVPAVGGV